MNKEDHKLCAVEIMNQLGGRHFMAMCSVKFPTYDTDLGTPNLAFKFQGSRTFTHCKIVLDAMDTYTVTFYKISPRTADIKTVKEYTGIYNDMLQSIFKQTTGLNTHL
jgi:hypothetical protein